MSESKAEIRQAPVQVSAMGLGLSVHCDRQDIMDIYREVLNGVNNCELIGNALGAFLNTLRAGLGNESFIKEVNDTAREYIAYLGFELGPECFSTAVKALANPVNNEISSELVRRFNEACLWPSITNDDLPSVIKQALYDTERHVYRVVLELPSGNTTEVLIEDKFLDLLNNRTSKDKAMKLLNTLRERLSRMGMAYHVDFLVDPIRFLKVVFRRAQLGVVDPYLETAGSMLRGLIRAVRCVEVNDQLSDEALGSVRISLSDIPNTVFFSRNYVFIPRALYSTLRDASGRGLTSAKKAAITRRLVEKGVITNDDYHVRLFGREFRFVIFNRALLEDLLGYSMDEAPCRPVRSVETLLDLDVNTASDSGGNDAP